MIERTLPNHWPSPPPSNAERIASWQRLYDVFRPRDPEPNFNSAPNGAGDFK